MELLQLVIFGIKIFFFFASWVMIFTGFARMLEMSLPAIIDRYILGKTPENLRADLLEYEITPTKEKLQKIVKKYDKAQFDEFQKINDGARLNLLGTKEILGRIKKAEAKTPKLGYHQVLLGGFIYKEELGKYSFELFAKADADKINQLKQYASGLSLDISKRDKATYLQNASFLKKIAKEERNLITAITTMQTKTNLTAQEKQNLSKNREKLDRLQTLLGEIVGTLEKKNVHKYLLDHLNTNKMLHKDELEKLTKTELEEYQNKFGSQAEIDAVHKTKSYTTKENVKHIFTKIYRVTNAIADCVATPTNRRLLIIASAVFTIILIATGVVAMPIPALAIALAACTIIGIFVRIAFDIGWEYYKIYKRQRISEELLLQEEILQNMSIIGKTAEINSTNIRYEKGVISPFAKLIIYITGFRSDEILGYGIARTGTLLMNKNFVSPSVEELSGGILSPLPAVIRAPLNILARLGYFIFGLTMGTGTVVKILSMKGEFIGEHAEENYVRGVIQTRANNIEEYKNLKELRVKAEDKRNEASDSKGHATQADFTKDSAFTIFLRACGNVLGSSTLDAYPNAYNEIVNPKKKLSKFDFSNKQLDDTGRAILSKPDGVLSHPAIATVQGCARQTA